MSILVWFKSDLRLHYNTTLTKALDLAANSALPVHFVYIHDQSDPYRAVGASANWLDQSLTKLNQRLSKIGGVLHQLHGDAFEVISHLTDNNPHTHIFYSKEYSPYQLILSQKLSQLPPSIEQIEQNYLLPPVALLNKQKLPYKVFTPFYKTLKSVYRPLAQEILPAKCHVLSAKLNCNRDFLVQKQNKTEKWKIKLNQHIEPGELTAIDKLKTFTTDLLEGYNNNRNLPTMSATSELATHLRFGEISPHYIWQYASGYAEKHDIDATPFLRQLAWRDFNHYLQFHFPEILTQAFNKKFSQFPWHISANNLSLWQQGETGYPIVDAGMKELWQTGNMHNRVRMIVASFLTKHLLLNWRDGEQWFWHTLNDADFANNIGNWQWVAGSGADASPYFRIFNPIIQGEKFDKQGDYIRRWLPQLAGLPNKVIHQPWIADKNTLSQANVKLGHNYPQPIIDHKFARQRALDIYQSLSSH